MEYLRKLKESQFAVAALPGGAEGGAAIGTEAADDGANGANRGDAGANDNDDDGPTDPRAALAQNENMVRWTLRSALELLEMMDYITTEPDIVAQFLTDAMAPRVAAMLNVFLDYLVGEKRCVGARIYGVYWLRLLALSEASMPNSFTHPSIHFAQSRAKN